MIPLTAVVHVRNPKREVRIWAPLFLIWLVLAPFALVVAPVWLLASLIVGRNPFRAAAAFADLFCGLSGLNIQVDSPAAQVLVRIR